MNTQHEDLTWKKLGVGDLILCVGNRAVSLAIGIVLIVALLYIDKLPIPITVFVDDPNIGPYLPMITTGFKWAVGAYFIVEFLILTWGLLAHFAIRYRLADDCVVKKGGVYRTYTHTIPRNRVQGVEVTASPWQRVVRVSDVTITTAGVHSPNMTIHNLATPDAVAIQNELGVDRD